MVGPWNDTRNQHFLSQVEQRLNTSTPNAADKNQRIYQFEVLGRSPIKLGEPEHKRIRGNLALDDVFSFEVDSTAQLRQNFETLFQRYENDLAMRTANVLEKAEAKVAPHVIRDDLIQLFAAKFLNFLRNPHSVPKMLDTFARVSTLRPSDPDADRQLDLVLNGNKPHLAALCKRLDLTEEQYRFWLGTQFMMLSELKPGTQPLYEGIVQDLFTKKTVAVGVTISRYTEACCLLSDRSVSSSIARVGVDCLEFNLRENAFIRYVFTNRAALLRPDLIKNHAKRIEEMEPTLVLDYRLDDIDHLAWFNLNVINQCRHHVYCSVAEGVLVADAPRN